MDSKYKSEIRLRNLVQETYFTTLLCKAKGQSGACCHTGLLTQELKKSLITQMFVL